MSNAIKIPLAPRHLLLIACTLFVITSFILQVVLNHQLTSYHLVRLLFMLENILASASFYLILSKDKKGRLVWGSVFLLHAVLQFFIFSTF